MIKNIPWLPLYSIKNAKGYLLLAFEPKVIRSCYGHALNAQFRLKLSNGLEREIYFAGQQFTYVLSRHSKSTSQISLCKIVLVHIVNNG